MKYHPVHIAIAALSVLTLSSRTALAHCDTLDGPVVEDARIALDSKDVAPVLKWIAPDEEDEIRELFRQAPWSQPIGSSILLSRTRQLVVWDALIVEAAWTAGWERVLSEDLQHGQDFGGVVIENPFA